MESKVMEVFARVFFVVGKVTQAFDRLIFVVSKDISMGMQRELGNSVCPRFFI